MVRAPSAVIGAGEVGGVVAEDRAEGEQAAGAVGGEGAVEAGEGFEDGRVELGHVAAAGEVVQGALGQRVAGGQLGRAGRTGLGVGRARSWGAISRPTAAHGSSTTTNRPPWRLLGQVERGLEEHPGEPRVGARPPRQTANFAAGSRIRQRPCAKANACAPPANSLISWFGLSTRQTCPPARVARAWGGVGPAQGTSVRPARRRRRAQRSTSMISASFPSRSTRKSVRLPSQSRWMLLRLGQLDAVGQGVGRGRPGGWSGSSPGPSSRAPVETRRFS